MKNQRNDSTAWEELGIANDFLFGKIMQDPELCKELLQRILPDNNLTLSDGVTKIFLNAEGRLNDVSKELKAFLDYVAGKKSEDSFVKKLERAVKEAKKNRKWRHEYMTLLMRDQENIAKGVAKGISGMISALRDLKITDDIILQKIQEKFELSREDAEGYLQRAES